MKEAILAIVILTLNPTVDVDTTSVSRELVNKTKENHMPYFVTDKLVPSEKYEIPNDIEVTENSVTINDITQDIFTEYDSDGKLVELDNFYILPELFDHNSYEHGNGGH